MSVATDEAIRGSEREGIVVAADHDDREDEGDLVCARPLCVPQKTAFIARHACGAVCTR